MRITRIDHAAVCTKDIDSAIPAWLKLLGLHAGAREFVDAQKTEAAFLFDRGAGRLLGRADHAEGRQSRAREIPG